MSGSCGAPRTMGGAGNGGMVPFLWRKIHFDEQCYNNYPAYCGPARWDGDICIVSARKDRK